MADIVRRSYKNIIRVPPALDTSEAYGAADVLFISTEIPKAVIGKGGCSKLVAFFVLNQNLTDVDVDFIFTENSATFGSINETANISDANIEAAKVIGFIHLDSGVSTTSSIDNSEIKRVVDAGNGDTYSVSTPILLQAAADSTSVYVAGIITGGTPTLAADDIDLIFHIEY